MAHAVRRANRSLTAPERCLASASSILHPRTPSFRAAGLREAAVLWGAASARVRPEARAVPPARQRAHPAVRADSARALARTLHKDAWAVANRIAAVGSAQPPIEVARAAASRDTADVRVVAAREASKGRGDRVVSALRAEARVQDHREHQRHAPQP